MKIGNIDLGNRPVMLAPMEDVTDLSFRLICKEQGADMVYTEFVSADALIRNIAATTRKLHISPGERPTAIQIYGREPDTMAEAARIVADAGPDIIDINFGCPVKKVAGKGAGAGLLRDVPKMLEITRAVVNAVDLPVTAKTRLGWDHENKIIVDLAEQLQDCGIKALTVHGRTRSQMYTGSADWEMIARVRNNPRLTIPLIGNGDICTPQQVAEAFDRYGVDGVMVGRASIGAPWIFRQMKAMAATGQLTTELSVAEKFALLRRQIRESIDRIDDYRGILHIR
ncbi:MAG: tRNA dihydrouridine synthase DusB, partial [Paramuribaculum sp.]|nr:tRNA dihydrouridine synthase DusB [Paramuribaculum sp.]